MLLYLSATEITAPELTKLPAAASAKYLAIFLKATPSSSACVNVTVSSAADPLEALKVTSVSVSLLACTDKSLSALKAASVP